MEKSSGPRTDPWETPTEHEFMADEYISPEIRGSATAVVQNRQQKFN